jgi:trehalose 6-phosphate phosphatase
MVDVDTPPNFSRLPEPLVGALRELARTRQLLVALDFDGTLAPVVDKPDQARALPAAREAVLRLSVMPRTRVAVISGRSLSSLEEVADLPDNVLHVGSHGVELRLDEPAATFDLTNTEQIRIVHLEEMLTEVAENLDQVWLEPKPAGFALHTRLATEENSRVAHLEALEELEELGDGADDYTVREGKDVLEISVRTATKGDSIEHLRTYTDSTAVFFAGDDVTDEDGFEALGADDLGLKAGEGATLANFRVKGPEDVARVLTLLADLREGDVHEQ